MQFLKFMITNLRLDISQVIRSYKKTNFEWEKIRSHCLLTSKYLPLQFVRAWFEDRTLRSRKIKKLAKNDMMELKYLVWTILCLLASVPDRAGV